MQSTKPFSMKRINEAVNALASMKIHLYIVDNVPHYIDSKAQYIEPYFINGNYYNCLANTTSGTANERNGMKEDREVVSCPKELNKNRMTKKKK